MSCYHPLLAYKDYAGRVKIVARASEVLVNAHSGQSPNMELPCGVCIGCRLQKTREWSIRMTHEGQLWDSNLFLTLTYDEEHLPRSLSLEYRDFQLFMKALRKEVRGVSASPRGTYPVRYFVSGEYGGEYGRPHFHAILFNADFADKVRFVNGTYRSAQCESVWQRGNVVIGTLSPRSAAYVAGYTLAKVYGQKAVDHYEDVVNLQTGEVTSRQREFCEMSVRPGIGAWWYEKFGGDVFPGDFAVQDARKFRVPRYYWKKYSVEGDPFTVEEIEHARFLRAQVMDLEERSERRRSEREIVAWSKLKTFSVRRH